MIKLCLPEKYKPSYPENNIDYYSGKNTKVLRDILIQASKGYCMYCGTTLIVDQKSDFQLEHSVDKEGNYNQNSKKSMLRNCKFNFSAACSKCNMIYKKRIEKIDFNKYNLIDNCPQLCTKMCKTYMQMREDYCKQNAIILSPLGFGLEGNTYIVCYNLLRHVYEPEIMNYREKDCLFIMHHIMRFALNRENFSSNIVDICAEICELNECGIQEVDLLIKIEKERNQPNIIGNIFVDFLYFHFRDRKIEDIIELCKLLVLLSVVV